MKNKGFTVVELIVSFCLVTAISIMLFQIIISLKELYISGDIKTTLLNKQGIMERKIYDDLNSNSLTSITSCGVSCLNFSFNNGDQKKLLIDVGANSLTYDTYSMKLIKGSYFGQVAFSNEENVGGLASNKNSILTITIPIESKLLPNENFGIQIVKSYKYGSISINNNLPISSATIVANSVTLPLNWIAEDEVGEPGYWLQILHQDNGYYFTSQEEFLKSKDAHKLSSLISLESFRSKNKKEEILNSIVDPKELEKETRNYQKGYFEFLLKYNTGVYSQFTQTSNFAFEEDLKGFHVFLVEQYMNGLNWKNSNLSFAYGQKTDENRYSIGVKTGNIKDALGNAASNMDLLIRVDEYISKYSLSNIQH